MRFRLSKSQILETDRKNIKAEVQSLCREVSFKFTPNPSWDIVYSDTITALGRFRVSVRNKANAYDRKKKEVNLANDGSDNKEDNEDDIDEVLAQNLNPADSNGLDTGLRPTGGGGYIPKRANRNVETFLFDLEKQMLDHVHDMKEKKLRTNKTERRIEMVLHKLKGRKDLVVARTDKTNSVVSCLKRITSTW